MVRAKDWVHPCLSCGACCAYFRVSFYWREAEFLDQQNAVPLALVEDLDSRFRAMKGTNKKHHPSCVALKGRIGKAAKCTIYENRPSPCRDFAASYEYGIANPRCDDARRAHGLPPLTPGDMLLAPPEISI